jgi:hypothetical protein
VLISFLGYCGSGINLDIIIYFCLLHNQGGRFKIISINYHVLCVLLFMNGFMPYVLIMILIFFLDQWQIQDFVNQCFTTVWHQ